MIQIGSRVLYYKYRGKSHKITQKILATVEKVRGERATVLIDGRSRRSSVNVENLVEVKSDLG